MKETQAARICVLLFLLAISHLCFSPDSFAQTDEVSLIEIKSVWGGLGPTSESRLSIKQKDGGFYSQSRRVDERLIEDLLREITEPVAVATLENLGITEAWLRANAEDALPERLKKSHPTEKELFLTSFQDVKLIEKIWPGILGGGWTDDYPRFELRIQKKDGSSTVISSDRQNIFMTPFAITENGESYFSYNANLSRAIAALLPEKFTNRERLSGERLPHHVADRVMLEIEEKLNQLETRNKIGEELKQIEGRYTLKKTTINRLLSVDVGTLDYSREKFPRWNAELQRTDLPQNVVIGVSLPYENGKLTNFDLFKGKIDSVVNLTLSVTWLSKYLSEHPETTVEVRFVTDRSVSARAAVYFLETLKELGAEDFAARVQDRLPESAFIQITEHGVWSRWIVLPDRKMVLFDFRGDEVLGWKLEDFTTRNRFDTNTWHMAGALISPTGEIEIK